MGKRIVRAYEPATVQFDPPRRDDAGQIVEPASPLKLLVKRMSWAEASKYGPLVDRSLNRQSDRFLLVRRPGDEQARTADTALSTGRLTQLRQQISTLGAADGEKALDLLRALAQELYATDRFVVPDEEIRQRRLVEMDDATKARYDKATADDDDAYKRCIEMALPFVKVEPGQLWFDEGDGVEVELTTGEQLGRWYGGRTDLMNEIALLVMTTSQYTDAQKNAWRSLSDLRFSSPERDLKAAGESSGPTAVPAGAWPSATSEGATATDSSASGPTVS